MIHVQHFSHNAGSPLAAGSPGSTIKDIVAPLAGERAIQKAVNSAFIGTDLEDRLHAAGATAIVITGLTINHCVETTTRMAGNLGFDTYFVSDATATFDRVGPDGKLYSAEDIQAMTLANRHGEFASVITTDELLASMGMVA